MRARPPASVTLAILCALAGAAVAQAPDTAVAPTEPRPPPPPSAPRSSAEGVSHQGQVQASLRLGVGLRALVPYEKGTYCGATDASTSSGNAPVCAGRAPLSLDLELGYGIARRVDLLLEMRVGLESDFGVTPLAIEAGPRMFHLSPGARFFFSDAPGIKLFTTAQAVFDFAGYEDLGGARRGADLGLRNLNGLWFDLHKSYGVYVYMGETLTFSRWLRFELEGGIGVQGRYP